MKVMYLKRGTASTFTDTRLGIKINDNIPAVQVDYGNCGEDIFSSLASGEIVQIGEAEFWSLLHGLTPLPTPIIVNTNYLLTLTNSLNVCPSNTAILWVYQDNQWYKTTWGNLKSCVSSKYRLKLKMGKTGNPIAAGDTTYTNPSFIGKNMRLRVNGVDMYSGDDWDIANDTETNPDYVNFNIATGEFTRPAGFNPPEVLEFYEL